MVEDEYEKINVMLNILVKTYPVSTKNEIVYIMTDRSDILLDVSDINSLSTGSDHPMIKGKARIDTRFERAKMVAQPKKGRYR